MAYLETTKEEIRRMLGKRPEDMHKGQCGRVLLVCGSFGMAGAAVMSAAAALRSGAGLVTVAAPREVIPIIQTSVPEAMCIEQERILYEDLSVYDAVGAGCGLGTGHRRYRLIEQLLFGCRGPLVIDADGINCLCRYASAPPRPEETGRDPRDRGRYTTLIPELIRQRTAPVIMTPHPGEARRLLTALEAEAYLEAGRDQIVTALAERTGGIIVLKGAGTLIASGYADAAEGPRTAAIRRNTTGNPGMACGGSGDVLTGVITALAAYAAASPAADMTPEDAAQAGVFLHGYAGDIAAARLGQTGMTAMDIVRALPEAFRDVTGV